MTRTSQISIRLEPELIEQADNIAAQLAKATVAGLEPTRATVLRTAIERGLAAIQLELDAKTRRPRR
jgi:predicted DNA-binding protein